MKIIKMILISMMVLCFINVTLAEESIDELSVDFSTFVLSRYVGVSGAVVHDDVVMQSGLYFENLPVLPKGFYVDLWNSWSLDHGYMTDDYGDELDYTFGWAGEFEEVQVDVGAAYFDYVDLLKGCDEDFMMFHAEIRKTETIPFSDIEISPFFRSETHVDLSSDSGDGIYLIAGIDNSFSFAESFSLDQRLALIYDSGAYHFGAGWVGNYGADLNWKISDDIKITPLLFKVYLPENSADGKGPQTVIGSGISIAF